jgi:hypothetical protein
MQDGMEKNFLKAILFTVVVILSFGLLSIVLPVILQITGVNIIEELFPLPDVQRLRDVNKIREALQDYYTAQGRYPISRDACSSWVITEESKKGGYIPDLEEYLLEQPHDPEERPSRCPDYCYRSTPDGAAFRLSYCLSGWIEGDDLGELGEQCGRYFKYHIYSDKKEYELAMAASGKSDQSVDDTGRLMAGSTRDGEYRVVEEMILLEWRMAGKGRRRLAAFASKLGFGGKAGLLEMGLPLDLEEYPCFKIECEMEDEFIQELAVMLDVSLIRGQSDAKESNPPAAVEVCGMTIPIRLQSANNTINLFEMVKSAIVHGESSGMLQYRLDGVRLVTAGREGVDARRFGEDILSRLKKIELYNCNDPAAPGQQG